MTHRSNRVPTTSSVRIWIKRFIFVVAAALLSLAAQRHCLAGSATWSTNPSSSEWNTAANWMPNTVPNGPSDIANFDTSNVTNLLSKTTVELDSIVFNSGADPFTITSNEGTNLILTGTGVVNNSGVVQSFIKVPNGAVFFFNNATAGEMTSYSGVFFSLMTRPTRDPQLLTSPAMESSKPPWTSGITRRWQTLQSAPVIPWLLVCLTTQPMAMRCLRLLPAHF